MKNLLDIINKYNKKIILVLLFTFLEIILTLLLPIFISRIISIGTSTKDINEIIVLIFVMIGISIASLLASLVTITYTSDINTSFSHDLRKKIFNKLIHLKPQDSSSLSISSNITRTTNDVYQLQITLSMILRMGIFAPIMTVAGLIISYSHQPKLTIILFIISSLLSSIIIIIGRKMMPLNKYIQEKIDNLNLLSREMLKGVKTIRSFNRESYICNKFDKTNRQLLAKALILNKYSSLLMPVSMMIMNIYILICLSYGSNLISVGELNPADIVSFIQYGMQILFGFIMLSIVFTYIPRATVSFNRIKEVLNINPSIVDVADAVKIKKIESIEFRNVCFKVKGSEGYILKDINFIVKNHEKIGIVGSIGTGKTTILKLILRFYDATEGEILINNINIKKISQQSLTDLISYVPQNTILFKGSIAENVRYGNKIASDDEIYKMLKFASIEELIQDNVNNLEFQIEALGKNLSGGQKQRLSIARTFIKKADVYMLDDSFSSLDFKVTSEVLNNIKAFTEDKILFLVSQRANNLQFSDKIIVMNDGYIDSIGTHKELLNKSKIYQEIIKSQEDSQEAETNHV